MASSPCSSTSSSFDEFDDDSFEHTLLVVREVSVFKIPPRSTSGGYKCGEWLQSDKIWSGRLRVVSCKSRAEIRLEDPISGDLFAACFVYPGLRDQSVEPALDSSRYFVLKIEDGTGKHAFIGLGFAERNEAFDFNVALSDHEKHVKRESEKEVSAATEGGDENSIDIHPAVNHRLKEGETIRINVKHKLASGSGMLSSGNKSVGLAPPPNGSGNPKPLGLAPPPSGSGKIRSVLPPPPNDPAVTRLTSNPKGSKDSARNAVDPLSDFSQLERNLPSKAGTGTTNGSAAGWAAF
ncbi:uncharacterized protein At1g03900-like [Chenopodium quinoa]|uniref:NECAP PHear domain-containing protein n=1 Tax=Chenopodium quinoa TaxID=63459 RepID=A0A803LFA1_CHEQI|nr:uncharacterized protein At1g03900-like [Chenopodium quinoa]